MCVNFAAKPQRLDQTVRRALSAVSYHSATLWSRRDLKQKLGLAYTEGIRRHARSPPLLPCTTKSCRTQHLVRRSRLSSQRQR